MKRYDVFRKLLDFVSADYEVTDADMNTYLGNIEVCGVDLVGRRIKIEVNMIEEDKDNGN